MIRYKTCKLTRTCPNMTLAFEGGHETQTLKMAIFLCFSGHRFNGKLGIYQIKYAIFIVAKD